MGFKIETMGGDEFLTIKGIGAWTEVDMKGLLDLVKDQAEEYGKERILLDLCGVTGPNSDLDRYVIGEYYAQVLGIRFKVAAVGMEGHATGFGALVAKNRGARLRVFTDIDEAKEWLRE